VINEDPLHQRRKGSRAVRSQAFDQLAFLWILCWAESKYFLQWKKKNRSANRK